MTYTHKKRNTRPVRPIEAYQFNGNFHNCPMWVAQRTEYDRKHFTFRASQDKSHRLKPGDWMLRIDYPFDGKGCYYRVFDNESFIERFEDYGAPINTTVDRLPTYPN